jgi:hypothetical protein
MRRIILSLMMAGLVLALVFGFDTRTGHSTPPNSLTTPDRGADLGLYTGMGLDSRGFPIITYFDATHTNLKLLNCGDANCASGNTITVPFPSGNLGEHGVMELDSSGFPVAAYVDFNDGLMKLLHCGDASCSSGNSITVPDPSPNGLIPSSLKLDSGGRPVISILDTANQDLKVVHCGDADCSAGNVISTPDSDGSLALNGAGLALDSSDRPVVAYSDDTHGDLKILHCGDANCTSENSITSPDTAGTVGESPDVALDANGFPVVAYYDQTNADLKILHCGDANCTAANSITAPDTDGEVGSRPALTLDANGFPVVAYFDQTNHAQKLLHCGDENCSSGNHVKTVDSSAQMSDSSIALDASGFPVVSYRGVDALKVLHCTDGNCDPDATPLTVTIEQAAGQADPASAAPISFTVTFSEPVSGFDNTDLVLGGTGGATTAVITGGPQVYDVAVSGMSASGTVIVNLAADAVVNGEVNAKVGLSSADNSVGYNQLLDTDTPAPTDTLTPTPSDTPTDTPSPTATDTATSTPTDTPSPTATDTPTDTPSPTATDTPTSTPTDTPSPTATDTPTSTPTVPSPTATDTPTSTPTVPSPTATDTPTSTPTVPSPTATDTPTSTPTVPSPTATDTPTSTPTDTPSPTATDTPTSTPTNTTTDTPTSTPTDTPSPTATDTPTSTPTNTATDTPTSTPTYTATNTLTSTPTYTATNTLTSTPTYTPTNTLTSTPTYTATNTATSTPTNTPTNTPISGQQTCSANLVRNGSFEMPRLPGRAIPFWIERPRAGSIDLGPGYAADGWVSAFLGPNEQLFQEAAVTAGKTYTLTFWAGTHDPRQKETVSLEFLNGSGRVIATQAADIDYDVDNDHSAPRITQYTLQGSAPNGAVKVRVIGHNEGKNTFKLDAVCLVDNQPAFTATPRPTSTMTRVPTATPTLKATHTPRVTRTPTRTPTVKPTHAVPVTRTPTRTATYKPWRTPTRTATVRKTPTPTSTPRWHR